MRAHWAEAALVALVVVKSFSMGLLWVVSRLRLGVIPANPSFFPTLPPSNTISGFRGHAPFFQVAEVVVYGLRPPMGAMGSTFCSPVSVFSVYAPTVSAF